MFTIAQAGSTFKILKTDGTVYTTLTLPTGVTVDAAQRAQFHSLAGKLIITRSPSVNLWVNPRDFSVRPLGVLPPPSPPTIAAGGGTGLTGGYYAAYSYIVSIDGQVVQESPLSPISTQAVLANTDLNWSNLVLSSESHVTGYRLYRTVADGDPTVMFLAQQVDNQSDTTFTGDGVLDAALSLLPSPVGGNAPGGTTPGTRLQCCVEWGNRLWGVADDDDLRHTVYYTEVGNPFAWRAANFFKIPVFGEDEFGVVGFLRRRDELIVGKRRRICKIVGGDASSFEIIILAEGAGFVATDSCVVIDDIGYALGEHDVWRVGPNGVESVSEGKVATWFQTDQQWDPASKKFAVGGDNPLTGSYDLHQAFAGALTPTSDLNGWASFRTKDEEWTGDHYTRAFSATARGNRYDDHGDLVPVIGGSDGFIYDMNGSPAYDVAGAAPTTAVGIAIDWRTKLYAGDSPDLYHVFKQPTIYQRAQGDGAGHATVIAFAGPYDERTQSVNNLSTPAKWQVDLPLSVARVVLPRIGDGQCAALWIRHNFDLDGTAHEETSDVELWGIELPFVSVGRR